MKSPAEYEETTIFKNVVLPTNYYTIDSKTNFTSTTKVTQICNDLENAISGDAGCGLIRLNNGLTFVGFYEVYGTGYVSITLGYYGPIIYLIGLANSTPYTRIITSTAPS